MPQVVSLRSIRDVRVSSSSTCVISGYDHDESAVEMVMRAEDVQHVAGPILYCAAMEAGAFGSKMLPGSIVAGGPLPVTYWKTGHSSLTAEPVLILTLIGGAELIFQFPGQAAQECGAALASEGKLATPPPGVKAN